MKTTLAAALAAALAMAAAPSPAKTTETDWCSIETPDFWSPGEPLPVAVTLKGAAPDGVQLCCHLHWMQRAAWGGMLSWSPGKPAVPGSRVVFNHRPKPKPETDGKLAYVNAMVFLAPGGDWARKVRDAGVRVEVGAPLYPPRPSSCTFKKSAVWVESVVPERPAYGEDVTVTVRYRLDPSDTWGDKPTQLLLNAVGPWIDNPDGVVNKNRRHVGVPGFGSRKKPVEPGGGKVIFTYRNKSLQERAELIYIAKFIDPTGEPWPWETRFAGAVEPGTERLRLVAVAPGGIWRDGETPQVRVLRGMKAPTGPLSGRLVVRDAFGGTLSDRPVTSGRTGAGGGAEEILALPEIDRRGCFSVEFTEDGAAAPSASTFVVVAPRVSRRGPGKTPFSATNIEDPALAQIAADLGFSSVRLTVNWKDVEPARGVWVLETLDRAVEGAVAAGLSPWLCICQPPSWALPAGLHKAGFEPAPIDIEAWQALVATLARRYAGSLRGFEWLNEIVPGAACADPVAQYVEICRAGTAAARAVDPTLEIQLAGGLWPHSFRSDLLDAGVAKYIDVLPVHYGDYGAVAEARRDLDKHGFGNVRVSDNETASGFSAWGLVPEQALSGSLAQCKWVMTRWPDELCAGASNIAYFGGHTQAAGNWTYLLDSNTPRPVAVTLALVQGALAGTRPVGKFFLDGAVVHLFDAGKRRGIAFVRREGAGDGATGTVALPCQPGARVLDCFGNVVPGVSIEPGGLPGTIGVPAGDMPVMVVGADLGALTAEAALVPGASDVPAAEPRVVVRAGEEIEVPALLRNPYPERRRFLVEPAAAPWGEASPVAVGLAPGESRKLALRYSAREGVVPAGVTPLSATVRVEGVFRAARKAFSLQVVDPSSLGNLVSDGGFGVREGSAWNGKGTREIVPDPLEPDNIALVLPGTGNWESAWQSVRIPVPGERYLYTAWLWNDPGMDAGSNMSVHDSAGRGRTFTKPHVFTAPSSGSRSWHYYAKVFDTAPDTAALVPAPVGRGRSGATARYDNVSVTLWRGSDYAAQARRLERPPVTDGDLSDWAAVDAFKLSLLCENQVSAEAGYEWSPANLSGVALFAWDADGLRLAVAAEDDLHSPRGADSPDGASILRGDAVVLTIRTDPDHAGGGESGPLRWYLSAAAPRGGSGAATLFRPAAYSRGGKAGELARDSSVYELAISRIGQRTCYELEIPWSELPGFSPSPGAMFECSLELLDSDGSGGACGKTTWGEGHVVLMP